MRLESRPPPPALAAYIDEFWSVNITPDETDLCPNFVLPDGTATLMFNLSGYTHRDLDPTDLRRWSPLEGAWLSGIRCARICIAPTVCTHVVGVRFKPGGLAPFLDRPAGDVTGVTVDLNCLFKHEAQAVHERLLAARTTQQCFDVLEHWLLVRLRRSTPTDERVLRCVELLRRSRGTLPIRELAGEVGMTQRHLARLFHAQVGLRPKLLARVFRFQSMIAELEVANSDAVDWANTALGMGYYDQSHLIDEMKELCGFSPSEYLRRRGPLRNFVPAEPMSVFSKTS